MKLSARYELQRQSLRLRLQANRLLLAQSTSGQLMIDDDGYPRSYTMRFLSSTPGLVTFLVAEVAPYFLGRYLAYRNDGK